MKLKFDLQQKLDAMITILFSFTFFSIPAFSYKSGFFIITWVSSVLLLAMIGFYTIHFKMISIDVVSISFLLFAISAFVSSLLNGFKAFTFTPILLSIITFFIYSYCKTGVSNGKRLLLSSYIAIFLFSLYFIFVYRGQIFSSSWLTGASQIRLGDYFGDINDVSIFFALGFAFSFFYTLFSKKIWQRIISIFLLFDFSICGILTGSKIFLIVAVVSVLFDVIIFFGKTKWYLSVVTLGLMAIILLLIFTLPFLSTVKIRFLAMISTLTGINFPGVPNYDAGTAFRYEMFFDGVEMFLRKPLFGYGIHGFYVASSFGNGWSHNNISDSLCNFGISGTILFHIGFVFSAIGYNKKEKTELNHLSMSFIIFFICCMVSIAFSGEKSYSYFIGIPMSFLTDNKQIKIDIDKLKFVKHFGKKHENNRSNTIS